MISDNPDLPLVPIWIPLDSFPKILHNQALSLLRYKLSPTWTLDMSLFTASEFGGAVDSRIFEFFLYNGF